MVKGQGSVTWCSQSRSGLSDWAPVATTQEAQLSFLPYLLLCFLAENSHAFLSSQRNAPYSWLPPWRHLLLIKEVWGFLEIISDQETTLPFDIKATHPFYLESWHFLPPPSSLCTSSFNKKALFAKSLVTAVFISIILLFKNLERSW